MVSVQRSIGELAAAAGIGVETVRYYERRGLLPAPPRTKSGYRTYDDTALARLEFVARAKHLGFTLAEIRELVGAPSRAPDDVLCAARAKLAALDQKLDALAVQQARLRELIATCEDDADGCVNLDVTVSPPR
jgi:DNA-binding transcriptional MerR regulator